MFATETVQAYCTQHLSSSRNMQFKIASLALALSICSAVVAIAIPDTDAVLSKRDEQNDVTTRVCRNTTLLFARGTSELTNMGGSVGPALATALRARLGASNVAVQGIDYPADVAGAVTGALSPATALGSIDCDNKIGTLLSYCPSTRIVIAGYSQGAEQVHGCLLRITQTEANSVRAAVTFGDPLQYTGFSKISSSRGKVFCNLGDLVCAGQFIIAPAHLIYTVTSIGPAVDFIAGVN
ncbi:cutinase-domain-containing protein [Auriculariales sp. MPI-PUGE-AT-0066]|nr:cutinase-domain-containing protein [Auriculariales sp. MPI-PUGE-AT-0066]